MIKFCAVIGLCAAVISMGDAENATKVVDEQEPKDNVAEASDFGSFFDLGSVSSGSLSSGPHYETGFTPISNTESHRERDEDVKTITVTKNVPVPYTVTVEKRVPVRVEVPVDKPYPVYVPRPYQVVVEKKVPYEVKVPVPHPYTVEKHVPVPVKVHVARPYPVRIPAPYPVFTVKKVPYTVEKYVPFPVKVPVVRPFPVHVTVEKKVPYPVEKTVPYRVEVHVERPVPVPVEKPYPVYIEKQVPVPVEKLVPAPVQIPVKIAIPIPVMSHHAVSPLTNQYYIHEQPESSQHQNNQYQNLEDDTKENENIFRGSESVHQVAPGLHQGQQQHRYHYEQVSAYMQPQAYGNYRQFQQEGTDSHAPQESVRATHNTGSSVEQTGLSNQQQYDETYRNNESNNQQQYQLLSSTIDDYTKQRLEEREVENENFKNLRGADDEYEALRAQSDSENGKQESYFKVHMGSAAYKSSVQHHPTTGGYHT